MTKTMCVICLYVYIIGWADVSHAHPIPSSGRSRLMVARQRPALAAELADMGFAWGQPIFMRIFKAEKQLELWIKQKNHFKFFKSYRVCSYGRKGLGPKTQEGDGRAPEGFYFVTPRQLNPHSRFHLSFNLGYPNAYDQFHGYTGSALMVHGDCVSVGCFAMTDRAMEEIYTLAVTALKNGQKFFRVHIFPFKMTEKNMKTHRGSKWMAFWQNLKAGYDWFADQGHIPPNVVVRRGRYFFEVAWETQ